MRKTRFILWACVVCAVLVGIGIYFRPYYTARANFYDAIQRDDLSKVRELLDRYPSLIRSDSPAYGVPGGLTILSEGDPPLTVAVMFESRNAFDYLLSLDIDVNTGGGGNLPPLITATAADDIYFLRELLDHGADRSVRDGHGYTAADWARQFEKDDFLDLLAE